MYATVDDIRNGLPEARLIELTDDENTGAVVVSRIEDAIADADAEIDAALGASFTGEPVPTILTRLSVDMAIYHLYSRVAEDMPELRRERYLDARRILKDGVTLDWPDTDTDPKEVKYRAV